MGKKLLQSISTQSSCLQFLTSFISSLSLHQGLSLSKEVGQKDLVMQTISDRMLSLYWDHEVTGNHACSLMNELVKCMLPIGARLSPHNRTSIVVHTRSFLGNVFAIRFHVTLLEVGSKAVHILVIGQKCMGFTSVAVYIPHSQHGQENRHILLQWSSMEVFIHPVASSKQALKVVKTNMKGDGETNG